MQQTTPTLRLKPIAFCCAIFLHAMAQAQVTLEPVISATRKLDADLNIRAAVTVITRADIEKSMAQDAQQLLKRVAGVDVARTGGPGSSTSVFMRGTNSNHVLVLIDGVRVASSNTGAYTFEQLPVEMIERIEIVRGPQAALWGSDAIGGLIHIYTRAQAQSEGAAPITGELLVGSQGRFRTSASAGLGDADFGAGISLSRSGLEGFSAQNPRGFGFDPDDDGSYANRALLSAHAKPSGDLGFKLSAGRNTTDVLFDKGRSDLVDRFLAIRADKTVSENYSHELVLGYASQNLTTPVFGSQFQSNRLQFDWHHNVAIEQGAVGFGLNSLKEEGASTSFGDTTFDEKRDSFGVYARLEKQFGAHSFDISGRHNDDSKAGSNSVLNASYGLQISEQALIYASFGQGFRAANFNELFSPGFGGLFAGNPSLAPEQSRSAELGVKWQLQDDLYVSASAFSTKIQDLISFSGGQTFRAENINRASIDGLELSASGEFSSCQSKASISLQDPKNDRTGAQLLRRAKRKASVNVSCDVASLTLTAQANGYSERADFGTTLPGYGTLDLGLSTALSERTVLSLSLENALDKNYELASGFNTPGQTLMLSLRWQ
jgi:vitamin B12 transporter